MLPRVIIHNAVSLDGRLDGFMPDIGLFYELAMRWQEDATLAGSDTLLAAEAEIQEQKTGEEGSAEEQVANDGEALPLLVVPDSRGRLTNLHLWRERPYWRDVVALCSTTTPVDYLEYLSEHGIECIFAGDDHVDLRVALEELNNRHGVGSVRTDSGGTLNGVLLREDLVDEVSVLIHPTLVGGSSVNSIFRAPDLDSMEGATGLRLVHFEELRGEVIWLRYEVVK